MSNPKSSTTFWFDSNAAERLKHLAASSKTTEADVIRRALALYDLVVQNVEAGQTVKIEKPNGEKLEVVIPSASSGG